MSHMALSRVSECGEKLRGCNIGRLQEMSSAEDS